MGLVYSRAESTAPPPPPSFADLTNITAQAMKEKAKAELPNYLDLPPAIKYEDIQRETLMALKPETFEVRHHPLMTLPPCLPPCDVLIPAQWPGAAPSGGSHATFHLSMRRACDNGIAVSLSSLPSLSRRACALRSRSP